MKVLHIVAGSLSGGAARGACWLHEGLLESGVDSYIYSNSNSSFGYNNVVLSSSSSKEKLLSKVNFILEFFLPKLYKNKFFFSTGMFGIDFTKSRAYREADIIHLHWINDGFVNIKHLSNIDKPVIWTLRDMWPMTGGCHYSMECEKFKTGCGGCPQLNSRVGLDLSRLVLSRKRKYLEKNIKLVGISDWLTNQARESMLFNQFNLRTIHNNINTAEFFPVERVEARRILGIKTNKQIILAGSTNIKDYYKGFSKYLEALKLLNKNHYYLCFFGGFDKALADSIGFEYTSFGFLHDNISLRLVYSCADVYVAPSLMDAFGKTIAESMACGTPAVCFDATGPKDIVTHLEDGYKAKPFDAVSLAEGINWVLSSQKYDQICESAINKVAQKFDSRVIASKYIELYAEVLAERTAT